MTDEEREKKMAAMHKYVFRPEMLYAGENEKSQRDSKKEELKNNLTNLIKEGYEMPPHALDLPLNNYDYLRLLELLLEVLSFS
jgi:hypothetical protein